MNVIHTIYEDFNPISLPASKDLPDYISKTLNITSPLEMILYRDGKEICRFSNKLNSNYTHYLAGNKIIDKDQKKVLSINIGDQIVLIKLVNVCN